MSSHTRSGKSYTVSPKNLPSLYTYVATEYARRNAGISAVFLDGGVDIFPIDSITRVNANAILSERIDSSMSDEQLKHVCSSWKEVWKVLGNTSEFRLRRVDEGEYEYRVSMANQLDVLLNDLFGPIFTPGATKKRYTALVSQLMRMHKVIAIRDSLRGIGICTFPLGMNMLELMEVMPSRIKARGKLHSFHRPAVGSCPVDKLLHATVL